MFCCVILQAREKHEKLEPCQPAAVSSEPPSSEKDTQQRVGPPAGQDSKPQPSQLAETGTSRSTCSSQQIHSQSTPAMSISPSSTPSSVHQIVTSSQVLVTSSPADSLGATPHIHHSLPYNIEDVERNELLSITKLNKWDYPIFDLATQAQTTILSQVSLYCSLMSPIQEAEWPFGLRWKILLRS